MKKTRTAGIISKTFINVVACLRKGREPTEPQWKSDEMGLQVALAWKEQVAIGWKNFIKGRISKRWGKIQHKYYKVKFCVIF